MENVTWTKKEFEQTVKEHHEQMKPFGFTKKDSKRDVLIMMKDNNITIKG